MGGVYIMCAGWLRLGFLMILVGLVRREGGGGVYVGVRISCVCMCVYVCGGFYMYCRADASEK
ncbi:hypothetical protein DFP73DRAFT_568747 [Morchella snyderi]|nr:hypothetical protein DFP73DRAFT_568747 [Morchella snyderi]